MNEITLTKSSSVVLKKLYKRYIKRTADGMPKSNAADFGDSLAIHDELFPKWSWEDVDAACEELLNADLIVGFRADGYVYRVCLSDAGITFAQNLGSKNVSSSFGYLLELFQAIQALLPW